ncbi:MULTISPECIES: GAF domain-containing sensor histidine kinase [Trichocoleus]|uniref:histidine kinase n=1 Tax=Trichocoleus desertorum GB2-A4 TaxID=2933944 RepID=A0ABV0J5P6_9CYAN|nr:GAF domain-containing sensor histidine kinase [Trichocoleus sp. FACHB-46]MBD1863931.1 GAF domain-containing sensor histidine kinase [Trichocoleus sp. FACHB-46]
MTSLSSKQIVLEDILITHRLLGPVSRLPNFQAENAALHSLARQMVDQPATMLRQLVQMALKLCHAGTAGVSLLETTETGEVIFRWTCLAGGLAAYEQGSTPCHFSPCGTCIDRGAPQLYSYPEQYFTYFQQAKPTIVEGLVIPLLAQGQPLGTIWIVSHDEHCHFDAEDVRVMTSLADFTAAALCNSQARYIAEAAAAQEQAARSEAEMANRTKDDFLSTVSHELRTPMTNIKMAIQMLKVAKHAEQRDRYMQILSKECDREIELINDLLDFQRLEAGAVSVELESLRLQDWLPSILEPFQERAKERQQNLQLDIPADLPPLLSMENGLERIVAELLNNACKYTPMGGEIVVSARAIALASRFEKSDQIELTIQNSGCEIPEPALAHIFEKFYRVPSHGPWKQGGTGLGLALVEKLVELLKGQIKVESQATQVVFRVTLPGQELGEMN